MSQTSVGGWVSAALSLVLLGVLASAMPAAAEPGLSAAIKSHDQGLIIELLRHRQWRTEIAGDGMTPLHVAVLEGDRDTVAALVRAGAKVDVANSLGVTPLSIACLNADAVAAETLLRAGANPNAVTRSGETVLMTAAWTGNADLVRLLLKAGAKVDAVEPVDHQTALMWAIAQGHPAAAQALIEGEADIRARSMLGFTPILFAARTGDVAIAKMLLKAGADVNDTVQKASGAKPTSAQTAAIVTYNPASSPCNQTCGGGRSDNAAVLLLAAMSGNVDLAEFLLDHGADANAQRRGLHGAPLRRRQLGLWTNRQ